jgi:Domain of Unknown Function (DUF928)
MNRIFSTPTNASSSAAKLTVESGMKAITIAVSSMVLLLSMSAAVNAQTAPQYPGKRVVGASRSVKCPVTPLNITALVPELDAKTSTKTTAADPIVWVYIPYSKSDVNSDKNSFSLNLRVTDLSKKVTEENPINFTEQAISLPEKPGIMPIYLPSGTQLEVGKSYKWELRAACENDAPFDIKLTIDRVAALPEHPLAISQPKSNIEFYAKKSIWLNAMTEVIKLNGKRPTLTPDAQQFLLEKLDGEDFKTSGLEANYLQKITEQPIVK